MSQQEKALSVDEAAIACGVSTETIRRRLRARKLIGAYREGPSGAWRIPVTALAAEGFRIDISDRGAEVERLERELAFARELNERLSANVEMLERHITDLRLMLSLGGAR
jgi:DeoR/GlpR family transcriptional regulator of sugar metabolism